MTINEFLRSRLTFELLVKVAHIGVPSACYNTVFSEITMPIELKFHMKIPHDNLAKM